MSEPWFRWSDVEWGTVFAVLGIGLGVGVLGGLGVIVGAWLVIRGNR